MSDAADCHLEHQESPAALSGRRDHSGATRRIALLAAGFLAVDFFTSAIIERDPPGWFPWVLSGILSAQFCTLAIWAALESGRWYARLLKATVLASLAWLAFAIGFKTFTDEPPDMNENVFCFTAFVPLLFLALPAPLWVVRWFRGWRLAGALAPIASDDREARRFSMADLLLMPIAAAIPLTLVRWQLKLIDGELAPLAIFFVCLPILSGLASLPCTYTAFRSRTLSKGFLAIAIYSVGLSLATNGMMSAARGVPPRMLAMVDVSLFTSSVLFATHGSLAILRGGWYLLLPAPAKRAQG